MSTLRDYRQSTKLSQAQFALRLSVATETYRMWDSGRREPPTWALSKARELAGTGAGDRPVGLRSLSRVLGVSVYRLREAARDGRLAVVYDTRVVFGRPVPRATRAAGEA